jgi:hypothetical protein
VLTTSPRDPSTLAYRVVCAVALFSGLVFARTRGIDESFWLAGDQIRDWEIALRSWRELPLTGPPSSVGGTTLGPIYYWTLWSIRHVIGAWTDHLPHAGGIGLSVIQSAADVIVLLALWRRASLSLALAVTLLIATAPQDMALTATIWNPPLAVALVKIAIAMTLVAAERRSLTWTVLASACAWLAVQAHSSAIFAAAPILLVPALLDCRDHGWMAALKRGSVVAAVIVVLQLPFIVQVVSSPAETRLPGLVTGGVASALSHPTRLRLVDSFVALSNATMFIQTNREGSPWLAVLIAAAIIGVAVTRRRDLTSVLVSAAPLCLATLGFATWRYGFDHYWYLSLMPSMALTLAFAITAWRPAAASSILLIVVLVAQPARLSQAMTIARLPEYRVLVQGSRAIRATAGSVAAIETEFSLPPTTDPTFIYRVLGGEVRGDASLVARIGADGRVSYTPRAAVSP